MATKPPAAGWSSAAHLQRRFSVLTSAWERFDPPLRVEVKCKPRGLAWENLRVLSAFFFSNFSKFGSVVYMFIIGYILVGCRPPLICNGVLASAKKAIAMWVQRLMRSMQTQPATIAATLRARRLDFFAEFGCVKMHKFIAYCQHIGLTCYNSYTFKNCFKFS